MGEDERSFNMKIRPDVVQTIFNNWHKQAYPPPKYWYAIVDRLSTRDPKRLEFDEFLFQHGFYVTRENKELTIVALDGREADCLMFMMQWS